MIFCWIYGQKINLYLVDERTYHAQKHLVPYTGVSLRDKVNWQWEEDMFCPVMEMGRWILKVLSICLSLILLHLILSSSFHLQVSCGAIEVQMTIILVIGFDTLCDQVWLLLVINFWISSPFKAILSPCYWTQWLVIKLISRAHFHNSTYYIPVWLSAILDFLIVSLFCFKH